MPTAVVMPICNEPVDRVFAGLKAIHHSLHRAGTLDRFHFFVLSDTNDPDAAMREEEAWFRWCREVDGFDVYSGPDHLVLWSLRNGATGCISGLGNVMPQVLAGIVSAFNAGDIAEAGVVLGLSAAWARCVVLERLGRGTELKVEAERLRQVGFIPRVERCRSMRKRSGSAANVVPNPATKPTIS